MALLGRTEDFFVTIDFLILHHMHVILALSRVSRRASRFSYLTLLHLTTYWASGPPFDSNWKYDHKYGLSYNLMQKYPLNYHFSCQGFVQPVGDEHISTNRGRSAAPGGSPILLLLIGLRHLFRIKPEFYWSNLSQVQCPITRLSCVCLISFWVNNSIVLCYCVCLRYSGRKLCVFWFWVSFGLKKMKAIFQINDAFFLTYKTMHFLRRRLRFRAVVYSVYWHCKGWFIKVNGKKDCCYMKRLYNVLFCKNLNRSEKSSPVKRRLC